MEYERLQHHIKKLGKSLMQNSANIMKNMKDNDSPAILRESCTDEWATAVAKAMDFIDFTEDSLDNGEKEAFYRLVNNKRNLFPRKTD